MVTTYLNTLFVNKPIMEAFKRKRTYKSARETNNGTSQ
jgi:hypothetical protein